MKRIWAAMILTTALTAPGLAADLGARTYAKAPVVAPVSNWSGFYVGGNLGYGWGNGNTDFSFLPTPAEVGLNNTTLGAHSTDITGGAQLGYNWQIGALVTGLEADIQGSDIKSSARAIPTFAGTVNPIPNDVLSSEQRLSWFGTVRGRLGVTVTPELLLYGTGGLAYGHVDASANIHLIDIVVELLSLRCPQASARPRSAGPPAPAPNGCSRAIGRPSWNTCTLTSAASPRSQCFRQILH